MVWLIYGVDVQCLKIVDVMLKIYEDLLCLVEVCYECGGSLVLELIQICMLVEIVCIDVVCLCGQLVQDCNVLVLLVGGQLDLVLLLDGIELQLLVLVLLLVGLFSDVLLQCLDIMVVEYQLLVVNVNIGVVCVVFFLSILLIGSIGSGFSELFSLFDSGICVWSFLLKIILLIFQGGKLCVNLVVVNVDCDIVLVQYEKLIQVGFCEIVDVLVLNVSLDEQVSLQQCLVEVVEQVNCLLQVCYDVGLDSFVILLDVWCIVYNVQQIQLQVQLVQQVNCIILYKVLGGGWYECG